MSNDIHDTWRNRCESLVHWNKSRHSTNRWTMNPHNWKSSSIDSSNGISKLNHEKEYSYEWEIDSGKFLGVEETWENGREGEGATAAAAASSQANRPGRRVDPLLVTCRFFSIVTTLTAILCIVSNVISAIRSF